ncbi:MAG: ABC transporter substrate-binding protein, partial [Candidatus Limnocylindria bacterium]
AELRAGAADVARDLSRSELASLGGVPTLDIASAPGLELTYLGLNLSHPPLDREEVRRAIAMSLDRAAIAGGVYAGEALPAAQFLLPGTLGHDPTVLEFQKIDRVAAKKLLADAGLFGITLDLHFPAAPSVQYPDPRRVAESLAADLAQIGIAVTVRPLDPATLRREARADSLALWLGSWTGRSGDPDECLAAMFAPRLTGGVEGPAEGSAWVNPPAWELLRRARTEIDESKRTELYKQVSKIVQREVPRIPLFHIGLPTATSRKIRGFAPHPTGIESLAAVSLER